MTIDSSIASIAQIHEPRTVLHRGYESAEFAQAPVETFIESLTSTPEIVSLACDFGYVPVEGSEADRLKALKKFSNAKWDFRSGKERQEVEKISFSDELSEKIFNAANQLGMVESTEPAKSSYDFVTILGGANMSPLLRVQYASEQLGVGTVNPPCMVLLGSSRKLGDAEKSKTAGYAPGAQDEFDLMNGAVETVFGVSPNDEHTINLVNNGVRATEKDTWRVRYYQAENGMNILSVSAPQIEGERRVNTADTYRFMHEVLGPEMLEGSSILNVTTAHFVPFQHADALRLLGLPAKAEIETIGYSAEYAGIKRQPHELLQEMNSAFNQADLLTADLVEFIRRRFFLQERLVHMMIETTSHEEAFGADPERIRQLDQDISQTGAVSSVLMGTLRKYIVSR